VQVSPSSQSIGSLTQLPLRQLEVVQIFPSSQGAPSGLLPQAQSPSGLHSACWHWSSGAGQSATTTHRPLLQQPLGQRSVNEQVVQTLFTQTGAGLLQSPHCSVVPQPSDNSPQEPAGQPTGVQH
jgi:hypothetical protein